MGRRRGMPARQWRHRRRQPLRLHGHRRRSSSAPPTREAHPSQNGPRCGSPGGLARSRSLGRRPRLRQARRFLLEPLAFTLALGSPSFAVFAKGGFFFIPPLLDLTLSSTCPFLVLQASFPPFRHSLTCIRPVHGI